jgi:hypothetical protein
MPTRAGQRPPTGAGLMAAQRSRPREGKQQLAADLADDDPDLRA